jgi:sec-independent protein translocase protein TatC
MAKTEIDYPDPDDMFKDTRMSFGDHLDELRTHLLRALKWFIIGMIISIWPLGKYVLKDIIIAPVEEQLDAFEARMLDKDRYEFRKRMERMQKAFPPLTILITTQQPVEPGARMINGLRNTLKDLEVWDELDEDVKSKASEAIGPPVTVEAQITDPRPFMEQLQKMNLAMRGKRLATMNITEAFMVYFKVAIMTGLVISSPLVFYQIWAFVAAGLYPHEKKIVHVYLPFSLGLFLSGVLVCQFMVMPKAIEAMLWFNEWLGLAAELRLNEWLGFALMMPIVFGISFQTPLVMMFLHKIGIVTVQWFRDYRKISWFLMAVFAAVITPSVDAFSMLFLWVPMGGLYELGILLCVYQGEQESLAEWEIEEKKQGELVEV